jgi:uncharacterized protein (DUF1778 family)
MNTVIYARVAADQRQAIDAAAAAAGLTRSAAIRAALAAWIAANITAKK